MLVFFLVNWPWSTEETFKRISKYNRCVYIFNIKLECCLISAAKEHEKNKERKSKDYGRSKAKKKKKKKKRTKPGKVFFLEQNTLLSFACYPVPCS